MTKPTVKALYQQITGDLTTHQRRIDAHFRRLTTHRQNLIRARLTGASYRQIAAQTGSATGGAVHSAIQQAIEAMRKAIAGEPRYNRAGHKGPPRRTAEEDRRGGPPRKSEK